MLHSINLDDKTYDEMFMEAIAKIPLYSDEWSNFNVSDPGITIIQNLTSFNMLQQSYINEVTEDTKIKLLKLMGIESKQNKPAVTYFKCSEEKKQTLPVNTKFYCGNICFETIKTEYIEPFDIKAMYTRFEDEQRDITFFAKNNTSSIEIFGPIPKEGMQLIIVCTDALKKQKDINIAFMIDKQSLRNDFNYENAPSLAEVEWQIYTTNGWSLLEVDDKTFSFLKSGVVSFSIEDINLENLAIFEESGYAIRCVLKKADYDLLPKLREVFVHTFKVEQRDTKAKSFIFDTADVIHIDSKMMDYNNVSVYCKEENNSSYVEYKRFMGQNFQGRFYTADFENNNIIFDKTTYGYAPCEGTNNIIIVCYDEETALNRNLGKVFGYDDQEINIHNIKHIISNDFSLLAKYCDKKGNETYEIVYPNEADDNKFGYRINNGKGSITIYNPVISSNMELILCDCAVTIGEKGNIRSKSLAKATIENSFNLQDTYINTVTTQMGESIQSVEELRIRFVKEMKYPTTAVLAQDYETIVKQVPGLCIHMVNAVLDEEQNVVKVVVKPHSLNPYPVLSNEYIKQISAELEKKRMITTKFEIVQPKYIPINVHVVVYVKSYSETIKNDIEQMLTKELNYILSDKKFGQTIKYNSIFRKIEAVSGVDSIYTLSISSQALSGADVLGGDILIDYNCLPFPNIIDVQMNWQMRN